MSEQAGGAAELSQQLSQALSARASTTNLNAGPSPLPLDPLVTAAISLLSLPSAQGMGVAEISHRSPAFSKIIKDATGDVKRLLNVPDDYSIIWMQGGGLTQFSATVLNILAWYRLKYNLKPEDEVEACYVVSGSWSLKAMEEGTRMGVKPRVIFDGRTTKPKFTSIAPVSEWDFSSTNTEPGERPPAFIYYCDNETVDGLELPSDSLPFPTNSDIPVIADCSSNFLSRPINIKAHGIVWAGAQKNLGPAGVSVIIIKNDLIVDCDKAVPHGGARVPTMLMYKSFADSDSLYNTPPTFAIYVCSLVLATLKPLEEINEKATKKSGLIYSLFLPGGFYEGTVKDENSRSRMNVTFRLKGGDSDLEKKFVKAAEGAGIFGIAGHRSVGGIRASLYNAVTLEQTEKLATFMREFQQNNS